MKTTKYIMLPALITTALLTANAGAKENRVNKGRSGLVTRTISKHVVENTKETRIEKASVKYQTQAIAEKNTKKKVFNPKWSLSRRG